ncbi:MAG: hypothetical protein IPK96_01105 [Flammeovirgaceae bacterium]|nr:hypothetical protein [Flammeovirgaceae bacterium]
MYLPVEKLRKESRVWIYVGSRALTDQELKMAEQMLRAFVNNGVRMVNLCKPRFQLNGIKLL